MKPETRNLKPTRWKLPAGSWWIPILLLLLVAFALRIHNLGGQSLWNDEGNSFVQSLRPLPEIISNAARDIHPPGYYLLLAGWRWLFGTSEFGLRSLSLFASLLTVAFTYSIGTRLFSRPAGWIAAAVVAINTFSIYYAQEARMYALLGLWSAAGMWLIVVYSSQSRAASHQLSAKGSSLPFILGLGFVNAAGLYTHYAYPFVMLVQGVVVLVVVGGRWLVTSGKQSAQGAELSAIRYPPSASSTDHQPLATSHSLLLPFTVANLLALLLFAPLLPTAIRQVTGWPSTGQPIPLNEALTLIGGWFAIGLTYSERLDPILVQIPQVLALFGLIGIVIQLWRTPQRSIVLMPLFWVIIPVGLFLLLGLFRPANLKFLLPAQIGLALWIGAAAVSASALQIIRSYSQWIIGGLLAIWLILLASDSLPLLYDDLRFQRADYRAITHLIAHDGRLADAVILNAPNQEEVFRYYLMNPMDYDSPYYHYARFQSSVPIYPLPAGLGGDDAATEAAVETIIGEHRRIFVLFWGEAERDPNRVVERILDTQTFQAGEDRWYGDVRLAIYTLSDQTGRAQQVNAAFGDSITLQSAQVNSGPFALTGADKRDVVQVELQWSASAALPTNYKVFLQLLHPDGSLAAQRDAEPVNGARPTSTWTAGENVTDRHGLVLPADLPTGDYMLIVGLYDPNTGTRLPIGERDYLELGTIRVTS
ncbi:MAG TPA: glycosyltransferase family 39 protein [Aggregatilineales bacterium]|nr:glycosyltransferase family 39 protein [Aggregatilineales bacterium]